ncbi:MAG: hypothetical protein R6X10_07930 [Desulfobacterales bacterium]
MLSVSSILLYSHPIHSGGTHLQRLVEEVVLRENIIIARQMDQVARILNHPLNSIVAAIIVADNEQELQALSILRDKLQRIPFILILPNQEKKMVTQAHSLRPRYLAYADGDLSDVRYVFKKIIGRVYRDYIN